VRRLLALTALAPVLAACGGSGEPDAMPAAPEPATETAPTTPAATTAEEPTTTAAATSTEEAEPPPRAPRGIPGFVAGYSAWHKLNDAPIPPRDADPHNGTKDVYVSRERRAGGRFPDGTIVVKEAARPGADFIGLIAIMRKERGADPEHGDWSFVEYTRDAAGARFALQASGAVCWSCHVGARDRDWVFTG
jgi:hypothetical protein